MVLPKDPIKREEALKNIREHNNKLNDK